MKAQLVSALKESLAEEKEIYKELLSLSVQKKDILIRNDVAGLNAAVRRETEFLKKLKPLAKYRGVMLEGLSKEAGFKGVMTWNEVIALLSGEERREMEALKEEFAKVVADLKKATDLNRRLIETHLEYTSFCISVLTADTEAPGTYENTGHVTEGAVLRRGLIDQKI